ncbi:MAG TPA: AAA family ATPase, partial [Jatrophihabitantaceae bacterium]
MTVPLTLVCAPAGAGKTTLAAGWTREADVPIAWVTLDSTDRDIRQFWTSVISALETLRPGCGKSATAELKRHVRVDVAIGHLLDDLESDDQTTALLVLDDLQLVDDDRAIIASLAEFAQHLPSWLHLVVLSRREPELPRDRLRARGQLGEVRYAELRFSPDEARELMSRLASPLTADDMEAAAVRADGWAAALQLAALAARSGGEHNAPGADGDELIIQDYMLREAFAAEAPELIDALSRVAVVERVNAGLAEALTDRPDAGALLEEAERRGLFVMRLDAEGWFAIHALARRALLAALRARAPEQLAERHVRAARWYEKTGDVPLALEQWLHAGRP